MIGDAPIDPVVAPPADDDLLIGLHEAGHACAAVSFGFPVWTVAICGPGDPVGGFVSFCGPARSYEETLAGFEADPLARHGAVRSQLPDRLVAFLAGPMARARATNVPYSSMEPYAWFDVYDAEWMTANTLHVGPCSAVTRAVLTMIEQAAMRFVTAEWPWIEAVAAELVAKRRLSGDDVLRLRPGRRRRAA